MSKGFRPLTFVCALFLLTWPALAQDRFAVEFKRLQGSWVVRGGEHDGKPMNGIKGGTLTITDRLFALHTPNGSDFPGALEIDTETMPLALDFVHADGTVWQAIYTVEGDTFTLNYVEAGGSEKRPTVFEAGPGMEASIIFLQRGTAASQLQVHGDHSF